MKFQEMNIPREKAGRRLLWTIALLFQSMF